MGRQRTIVIRRNRIAMGAAAAVFAVAVGQTVFAESAGSITEHMSKSSINVVITVRDMEKAQDFYGGLLGLEPMAPIPFSAQTNPIFFPKAITMVRYKVGSHEIKLIPGLETTQKQPGGVDKAYGFRMVNYPIPDIEAFYKRLDARGIDRPRITAMPGGSYRFGMLEDPDGNQVEFHYYDGEAEEGAYDTIHIALTVSDVEKSRHFYGSVLGLEEMPPVPMPMVPGGKVYLFRLGETLVKFWGMDGDLPTYSGRHLEAYGNRYLQYQVNDIDAVHALMKKNGANIELPPTSMESVPVHIMFVADPDGIINEIFGVKR